MTEEQAGKIIRNIFPVYCEGPLPQLAMLMAEELYERGYQLVSYLTGEDYEKQQERDFPEQARDFPASGYLPGDIKKPGGE